jgi:hypothetical protein
LRSRDARARQRELKKCNAYRKCRWQNLHSHLRLSWSYRHCEHGCKLFAVVGPLCGIPL